MEPMSSRGGGLALMAVLGMFVAVGFKFQRMLPTIPPHLLGHQAEFQEGLLSETLGDRLMDLLKEMKQFPTNAQDLSFYNTTHEHIGEARALSANGTCSHPYLIPSPDRTKCILAGRVDIARHFLKTGGIDNLREPYTRMVSRLLSFGTYQFDLGAYSLTSKLFTDDKFVTLAKKVCPRDKQHLDPFQFNFIIQVPGQTVATHVDGVYFWGATRFQFPQWLLAAMKFSNLFRESFIDQVQVVGYLHRWEPTEERKGRFVYWNKKQTEEKNKWNTPLEVLPIPLAGSAVDGSKTIHTARVYWPSRDPPPIRKGEGAVLTYRGDERWSIDVDRSSEDGSEAASSSSSSPSTLTTVANYTTDDLRISIVYRARCFTDEEEASKFRRQITDEKQEGMMTLEQILLTFGSDLARRGLVPNDAPDYILSMDRLELAILILDTYVQYPVSSSVWMPFNYCMAPRLYPWTRSVLKILGLCGSGL